MSTATIGRKNWQAIKLSGNGTIVAVASRTAEKAQAYIDECQGLCPYNESPVAIEGYDALLANENIDAVYIPLPTGLRHEWVIKAAKAGKHVMCEKPCARDAIELAAMIQACKENNVQFMDGVMYMHGNRLPELRNAIDTKIGKLKRIATQFSFCGDESFQAGNIRTDSTLEPLGCLGDLGWYTIRFALWIMNYEMPKTVTGRFLTEFKRDESPEPVPMEVSAEFQFSDGVTASSYNSFITGHQQWGHISGTEGNIQISDYVLPFKGTETKFRIAHPVFDVVGCDFEMTENHQDISVQEFGNSAPDSQETNLFRNFASIALSGKLDPHWPDVSLKTQRVMDAIVESAKNESRLIEMT